MPAEDMYVDNILDYYRNPRNFGTIENADASASDVNPLCGDKIGMHMMIENSTIKEIKFNGQGCAISQAASSMLTEHVTGKTLDEVKAMTKNDVLKLLGIEVSHVRIKCALLGLKVLKLAVYSYLNEKMSENEKEAL